MTGQIKRYEFIDALRGYAILAVLVVHSSMAVAPTSSSTEEFMQSGALGVQLFYMASALTLGLSWQTRNAEERRPVANFFIRRFFRIAPMFYVAILLYLTIFGFAPRFWAPEGLKWWYIALTFLFLHGILPETINSVVPGGWSIAVESSFYLLFPLLIPRIRTLTASLVFVVISLLTLKASKLALGHLLTDLYPESEHYLVSNFLEQNIFAQLPPFAAGITVFYLFERIARIKRWLPVADLLLISLWAVQRHWRIPALETSVTQYCTMITAFGLFALNLAAFPLKMLVNPVIRFIGRVSYSMYLTHFAVIYAYGRFGLTARFGKGNLSSILYFLVLVVGTAMVARFTYFLAEKPGIKIGRRLIDRLEAA